MVMGHTEVTGGGLTSPDSSEDRRSLLQVDVSHGVVIMGDNVNCPRIPEVERY
jgi:hypothetical protein